MPFPIITIGLSAAVFVFIQNIYVQLIAYAFLAVNVSLYIASKNLPVGLLALIIFCVASPFSLAYKVFLFGLGLGAVNGNLHGRLTRHVETVAGIALLTGAVMGLYNFFAH